MEMDSLKMLYEPNRPELVWLRDEVAAVAAPIDVSKALVPIDQSTLDSVSPE
jgi:hypothetical protein